MSQRKWGVAKLHHSVAQLFGKVWKACKVSPEKAKQYLHPFRNHRFGLNFFQPEGKLMKNILLASTALIVSAGFAAADTAMSASAKLTYGNYGTGTAAGAADQSFSSEADVDITMTGGGETVSYTAALELDESGSAAAALTLSTSGITLTYDKNDISDIADAVNADGTVAADGEDNNQGDIKIAYAGGGVTASYAADLDDATDMGYVVNLGYAAGDMSMGLETDGTTSEVSVGYTMGDIAFAANADNASTWDVSVAYTMGASTITVATDEASVATVALATTLNGLALSAKTGGDNEFSVGYAADAFGFAIAYDSGNSTKFGDEAETTLVVDYAIDGMGFQLKANNQSELELSTSLSF
jgi:outer membrane protein OmpU